MNCAVLQDRLNLSAMATSSPTTAKRPRPRNRLPHRWRGPLLAGFCFGLGYGVTQRLLALQLPGLVQLRQGFDVREFPGTSLESLRLRYGADAQEIRGDLEVLELERQARQREQKRQDEQRQQEEAEQRLAVERAAEERRQQELDELEPPVLPALEPDPLAAEATGPADGGPGVPTLPPPSP